MHVVLFITVSSRKEARLIAAGLLEDKLAACINIVDKIDSFFWWQGKVDHAQELLLIVKSRKDKLNRIIKKVKSLHSYTVPEIIALPVCAGYKSYLDWINESLR
jgi:periplasmic divalent cation tolerance protein